jgi:hypothetical protein
MFSRNGLLVNSLLTSRYTHARTFATNALPRTSKSRLARYGRRAAYTAVGAGAVLGADQAFNESAITRNLRTLYFVRLSIYHHQTLLTLTDHFFQCAVIAVDYKLNFTPETAEAIPALHERVADRLFNLLTNNGGLYIKMGMYEDLTLIVILIEGQVRPLAQMPLSSLVLSNLASLNYSTTHPKSPTTRSFKYSNPSLADLRTVRMACSLFLSMKLRRAQVLRKCIARRRTMASG